MTDAVLSRFLGQANVSHVSRLCVVDYEFTFCPKCYLFSKSVDTLPNCLKLTVTYLFDITACFLRQFGDIFGRTISRLTEQALDSDVSIIHLMTKSACS